MSSSYRDLRVWQEAMNLATAVYHATDSFPKYELFGLASQLRRAAVSIPSNIAEGKGRHTNREFGQFLLNARGSLNEVETQVELALRLDYFDQKTAAALFKRAADVGRALNGLLRSLAGSPRNESP